MSYENQSLRNRIENLASSLKEHMSERNLTATKLAQEILNHHGYRRQFTHKLKGLKKGESLPPSHWVVLIQMEDGGYDSSEPFEDKDDALKLISKEYGEVSEEFLRHILQPYVAQLDYDDPKNPVGNLVEYINNLCKYHEDDHRSLGFPNPYRSEEEFLSNLKEKQDGQIKTIASALQEAAQFVNGTWIIQSVEHWHNDNGEQPYPMQDIKPVSVSPLVEQKIYNMLAIEDFLFHQKDITLLEALMESHRNIWKNFDSPEKRPSIMHDNTIIGAVEGHSGLHNLIYLMAQRGFDFHPIFGEDAQCKGTLELKNVMQFLQRKSFDSIPDVISVNELEQLGLLSPAPPVLDEKLPLHRAGELLHSGIGCVLVRYNPERWPNKTEKEKELFDELDQTLEKGVHIFTTHDFVNARTFYGKSQEEIEEIKKGLNQSMKSKKD